MARREQQPHRFPTTVDIADRILDKGVVIESHAPVSIGGINSLVTLNSRYVVSSIDTHRRYTEPVRSVEILIRGDWSHERRRR
jgi:hypothetical protein